MQTRPELNGPLKNIVVLDFTRLLPGPLATMFFADMGADVIKIESPKNPDYIRFFPPSIGENSAYYYALNRNKKSLSIDYTELQGLEIIYELVKKADVFIEQFKPYFLKKFGLDFETLKKINPKLIYASITGYGQNSSMSDFGGHDLNFMAISGLLSTNGTKDEIIIPNFQTADVAGGSYMTMNAILAALFQRTQTNIGAYLDIAMTDCVVPLAALAIAETEATNSLTPRRKAPLSGVTANYNVFKCKDEKWLAVGAFEMKFWSKVCAKLGKPEWLNDTFSNPEKVKAEMKKVFAEKTRDEWEILFENGDVCITRINELNEVIEDKYIQEKKLFTSFEVNGNKISSVQMPVKLPNTAENKSWLAPKLGEDNEIILRSLNFSDEQIAAFKQNGIV
ncbi:MAG TPA: CaiB/BaiF CoA-transferase family protein [Chitinophagales bacterium]